MISSNYFYILIPNKFDSVPNHYHTPIWYGDRSSLSLDEATQPCCQHSHNQWKTSHEVRMIVTRNETRWIPRVRHFDFETFCRRDMPVLKVCLVRLLNQSWKQCVFSLLRANEYRLISIEGSPPPTWRIFWSFFLFSFIFLFFSYVSDSDFGR